MNQELERFEPAEVSGRLAYEHLHRYAICRDLVDGRRVLDVACGSGYGTNILAQVAAEATGVDIDVAAVRRAKRKYRRGNLKFVAADCYEMPFEADSFDVIVANEMIEHIEDHDRFMGEVRRILRPGGIFLVSTPNKPVYNRYKTPNPFHVSEMDIPEFRALLEEYYEHVEFIGLRMALVSVGFDLKTGKRPSNLSAAKTYRGTGKASGRPEITNDDLVLADPEYVLAICSDRPAEADSKSSTVYFSSEEDLWLEHEKVMAWASGLHSEDEALRADLRRIQSNLDEANQALDRANQSSAATGNLKTAARLMSRMTGAVVDAESTSMIEAMFVLNERLITQRAQLEKLSEVRARAGDLERQLESKRTEQDRLTGELRRAELRVEELSNRYEETQKDRDKLARKLEEVHQERDRQVQELADVRETLDSRELELRAVGEKSDDLAQEVKELKRLSSNLKAEAETKVSRLEAELSKAQSALTAAKDVRARTPDPSNGATDGVPVSGALQRRRNRLVSSHRHVREQLARSKEGVRNSIPASRPVEVPLLKRLMGSRPIHRTSLFDRDWIGRQVPDAKRVSIAHFLTDTRFHRIEPHPLFAAASYLDQNPDVAASGKSPLEHYLEHGWREGRDPHPYFANDWYLRQYPDVLDAAVNPLEHYLEYGWKEGRRPNPVFDPTAYLSRHSDVKAEGLEPLTHFVTHGKAEGRDVPFAGLERDWRTLVREVKAESLMDLMLSESVAAEPIAPHNENPADAGAWPPSSLNDFWIPQALRDFMVQRGWDDQIPLITYLYSVMNAFSDEPSSFPASAACGRILERARALSESQEARAKGSPRASIIIPVFNNVLDTMLCIVALLETSPDTSIEIIVADDCSDDSTAELIPQIGGIVRHLRQSKNGGFLRNCNAAAEQARGQIIVLLNNDTLALPGWLEALILPFAQFENVGSVGSKLINWDGRLQEAGGIFWNDGSAWNFGRGQNPLDPEFNYLKDVDYCSGASIAVDGELWRELGGFDASYSPAYCEDSDLAFRIRQGGSRTLYSPRSEIIHHEGRSHGQDTSSGIKAYQVSNQRRLVDRWRRELERDHFVNGTDVLRARDRSFAKPHILVIDHYVPQVDKDAGSRTMFQFLEALIHSGWAVTFWPENLHYDPDYTPMVQGIGVEVIYGSTHSGRFSEFLRSRHGLYDAVLLSRPHVAVHFIDDVRALTEARILYYGHDVHFERMRAQRDINQSTLEEDAIEAMKELELDLCNKCDVVLYPSWDEAEMIGSLVSKTVRSTAIPAYRFVENDLSDAEQRLGRIGYSTGSKARLLFVGGFAHGPNVDGIVWFCREIAPILRAGGFGFELQIAGSNPTSDVWDLESDDVHVLGFVSDEKLQSLYREASMVIAPLRFGAGVKGKVVEAMANGVPVVTTSVGAQGLSGAEEYLFIGNASEEFADAVRAAADSSAARTKAGAAISFVRAEYSQEAMIAVLTEVLPSVAPASKSA